MDLMGNAEARVWVSAVKAMVPERVCQIIDQAIQIHGATGVSQWTPLADMYTGPAHAAPGRRPRRGAPHGRRPGRDRPLPAHQLTPDPTIPRQGWRRRPIGRKLVPRADHLVGVPHAQKRRRSRPRPAVVSGQAPQPPQGRVLHGAGVVPGG